MNIEMKQYLNRIMPVVGNHLRDKSIIFFNPQFTHTIAESFARCGVKKITFIGHGDVAENSPIHLSYGQKYIGQKVKQACINEFKKHNSFEKDWEFVAVLAGWQLSSLFYRQSDLIVGGGSVKECEIMLDFARAFKIPAIIFTVFQGCEAKSLISVVDFKKGLNFSLFDNIDDRSLNSFSRLDFLETADLVASVAKSILLMGTEFERKDFNRLIYKEKKNNIIRGLSSWPWQVIYGGEELSEEMLALINSFAFEFEEKPSDDERLMIIGCGTASLLAGEAINFYRHILLVDCKPVSVFNPVRQLYGTEDIGHSKVFAAQRILARRVQVKGRMSACSPFIKFAKGIFRVVLADGHDCKYEIAASPLRIKEEDSDSIERFKAILDEFNPSIVIVGMGRTRDDNYVVAKILRERGIKHIVPAAFPLATHYKHIVVDGKNGPCYACLQGRLPIDSEGAVSLTEEQREMFYGEGDFEEKTQPATIVETWPSVHSALRLAIQTSLPQNKRSAWFREKIQNRESCFVGGNMSIEKDSGYLYGVKFPGQVVTYSEKNIFNAIEGEICADCGQKLT